MAKARKTSARRSSAPRGAAGKKTSQSARTAAAVAQAIAKARKAAGKAGEDMDIHVHVGDVVMMGFDEAVDAEEWGMRETNNEIAGRKGRGARGGRDSDPQDEKNRKVARSIKFRKGALRLEAVERSRPAGKKVANKKSAAKASGKKKAARKTLKKASRRARG